MSENAANDPRESFCAKNEHGNHRWARSFKDQISKTCYVQILRCRYCAHYVCVEFRRTILPSGRVEINERVFETGQEATLKLRKTDGGLTDMELSDNQEFVNGLQRTHTLA